MNQRRRPEGPPISPRGHINPESKYGYYWRRRYLPTYYWRHYWRWRDYDWYDYDYDYDDWYDYYSSYSDGRPPKFEEQNLQNVQYIKIDPTLIANLLSYASSNQLTIENIQTILDRMIDLSGPEWKNILGMEDFPAIINPPTVFEKNDDKAE